MRRMHWVQRPTSQMRMTSELLSRAPSKCAPFRFAHLPWNWPKLALDRMAFSNWAPCKRQTERGGQPPCRGCAHASGSEREADGACSRAQSWGEGSRRPKHSRMRVQRGLSALRVSP